MKAKGTGRLGLGGQWDDTFVFTYRENSQKMDTIYHTKMSLLLLIEDSGNRLPQRLPYFFQLRDAGGHQKGSDSGCVLTVGQKIKFQRQAEYGKNDFDSRLREASCRHL